MRYFLSLSLSLSLSRSLSLSPRSLALALSPLTSLCVISVCVGRERSVCLIKRKVCVSGNKVHSNLSEEILGDYGLNSKVSSVCAVKK